MIINKIGSIYHGRQIAPARSWALPSIRKIFRGFSADLESFPLESLAVYTVHDGHGLMHRKSFPVNSIFCAQPRKFSHSKVLPHIYVYRTQQKRKYEVYPKIGVNRRLHRAYRFLVCITHCQCVLHTISHSVYYMLLTQCAFHTT